MLPFGQLLCVDLGFVVMVMMVLVVISYSELDLCLGGGYRVLHIYENNVRWVVQ